MPHSLDITCGWGRLEEMCSDVFVGAIGEERVVFLEVTTFFMFTNFSVQSWRGDEIRSSLLGLGAMRQEPVSQTCFM